MQWHLIWFAVVNRSLLLSWVVTSRFWLGQFHSISPENNLRIGQFEMIGCGSSADLLHFQ